MEQQILAGRYRLDRQLGKGGMGSVWLAEHLALNSWVAVKLMDPAIASTTEGAERFRREAQAAASLRSAHVVQVLDYGVHDNTPFLVMELLQGQSLADCLEREKRLTPERTLAIISQVARAIGRAHASGIVHRDLKPDNIFLVREDDQELAKVLDFGIAKATGPRFGGTETRTGVTMGTPYYMSPEQVEGKKALDHRSDLWSLSVIACECLTGVRPFDGETFGELLLNICARPVLPPSRQGCTLAGFDDWFAKGTNRDPNLRFGSAQELALTLADVVAGRVKPVPLSAPQASGPDATLPMDPPTLLFTGGQPIPPREVRAGTADVGPRPPGLLEPRTPKHSALVLLLLGLGAVLIVAIAVLLFRSKSQNAALPEALPIDAKVLETPPPTPSSALQLAPEPGKPKSDGVAPVVQSLSRAAVDHRPSTVDAPAPLLPRVPVPAPAPASARAPTAAAASTARVLRCYSDPFTGQLRLAGAGHSADSFPCRQNAFTGAYQKL